MPEREKGFTRRRRNPSRAEVSHPGKMRYRFNPPPSIAFLTSEPTLDTHTA